MWTELVTTALAYAHILSAMGWLGGGILFGFVIAPRFSKMGLAGSRDFFVTVQPNVIRFFQIVAGLTVLFGVLLLYVMTAYGGARLSVSNSWGLDLIAGMAVAAVAFVISEFLAVPAFFRLIELNRKMGADGSNVPAELPRTARRAGMMALVSTILLFGALGFMVAAGFY